MHSPVTNARLGRLWCNPFKADLSIHAHCFNSRHAKCERWERVVLIPGEDINRAYHWIVRSSEFDSAPEHIDAWDQIVLGKPKLAPAAAEA